MNHIPKACGVCSKNKRMWRRTLQLCAFLSKALHFPEIHRQLCTPHHIIILNPNPILFRPTPTRTPPASPNSALHCKCTLHLSRCRHMPLPSRSKQPHRVDDLGNPCTCATQRLGTLRLEKFVEGSRDRSVCTVRGRRRRGRWRGGGGRRSTRARGWSRLPGGTSSRGSPGPADLRCRTPRRPRRRRAASRSSPAVSC